MGVMSQNPATRCPQSWLGEHHDHHARRTQWVVALTVVMMVAEILGGTYYGSMALVADGWHMATHAAALGVATLAYRYARSHARDPRFAFGTGKVGELAGFASAVSLAIVALLIGAESLQRLFRPQGIDFMQAGGIAVLGLIVNLVSARLLHHEHDEDNDHDDDHAAHHDTNLRAAYLHVMADALTSVLAIGALLVVSVYGWLWLDPAIGVVGALVIARWSFGLMRDAGSVLLDYVPAGEDLPDEIRGLIEVDGDKVNDLHVWQVGPGHHAAIVSLSSAAPKPLADYRARLATIHDLSHVTVEVDGPAGLRPAT